MDARPTKVLRLILRLLPWQNYFVHSRKATYIGIADIEHGP